MRKLKCRKCDRPKKVTNMVLVSSFHSDEEEPWTYVNRRKDEPLNVFLVSNKKRATV